MLFSGPAVLEAFLEESQAEAIGGGVLQIWGLLQSLSFLPRGFSTLPAPRGFWGLLFPPSWTPASRLLPRLAGALPGAGEEFPREQLNSAPAKNSPGPGPKAGGGGGGGQDKLLLPPAPRLHLDPRPGLGLASSLPPRPSLGPAFLPSPASVIRPWSCSFCLLSLLTHTEIPGRPGSGLGKRVG